MYYHDAMGRIPRALTVFALVAVLLTARAHAQQSDPCARGFAALERRDLAAAEPLLERCRTLHPADLRPYVALAGLYQLQGRADDLHRIALAGLGRFPEERRFYVTVGNRAGQEKRYARAIEVFGEGLRRWPEDAKLRAGLADAHAGLGMKQLDDGKNAEAEKSLRRAVELNPADVETRLNLGRALHNLNQSTAARAEFDRVIEAAPTLASAHFHRGMVLYALGQLEAAIADFDAEIRNDPSFPPSHLFRGMARSASGDCEAALPDLLIASERMPDNARAHFARGRCLARVGRAPEAEAAFRRTMELDPSDAGPVNALARLLLAAGRAEEAEPLIRRAAEMQKAQRRAREGEIRFESPRSRKPS
jgi:tetratricopeptide (TPR) repeat protein